MYSLYWHLSGTYTLLWSLLDCSIDPSVSNRLGMSLASVTQVEREKTKRVVYAVIYGVGKLF